MLEFIQGEMLIKGTNYVVVRAGGLGYRLLVSALTLEALPPLKEEVTLYTYLHIREDEYSLFGFFTAEEKEIFTTLLSVSGVGPKLALAILSRLKASDFKRVILLGDTVSLVSIPGVGKKTAERIILELKDKMGKMELPEQFSAGEAPAHSDVREQAVSALLALGYSLAEAQKAVPVPPITGSGATVEDLIRTALKTLAKY